MNDHIDPATARYITPWEVDQKYEAKKAADFIASTKKPFYTIPDSDNITNDWTGNRFVTSHRCFGHPCKSDLYNGYDIGFELL